MMVYQQQPTISFGLKGKQGRFPSESPPEATRICSDPEIVGRIYGKVKVVSGEKIYTKSKSKKGYGSPYVLTECLSCGKREWILLPNLMRGLSLGCQHCTQIRPVPKWLYKRVTAQKQRCENPKDKGYPNYGGRGIRFSFTSVQEGALWIMENLGLHREMELDRIDNNGNYEPGNLRYLTHTDNNANKRSTVMPEWNPEEWPYARSVVTRMTSAGMTREEILESARQAVRAKRKNWQEIKRRLESMTS